MHVPFMSCIDLMRKLYSHYVSHSFKESFLLSYVTALLLLSCNERKQDLFIEAFPFSALYIYIYIYILYFASNVICTVCGLTFASDGYN